MLRMGERISGTTSVVQVVPVNGSGFVYGTVFHASLF